MIDPAVFEAKVGTVSDAFSSLTVHYHVSRELGEEPRPSIVVFADHQDADGWMLTDLTIEQAQKLRDHLDVAVGLARAQVSLLDG
ncbi:hypothetical protein BJD99_07380 [Rhodococcus sp. 1163]|uniref:hypothetical protein n=1 Tax=Rhodococcus sp. 1163 TaxID=1905289 RepID=UPI0009FF0ED1|nr:hypothetical protein [Rhodococcus sp. 1163]ORI15817.1 hypothetical protein BJD99_07380 [Rhodococcus sp. 1163]